LTVLLHITLLLGPQRWIYLLKFSLAAKIFLKMGGNCGDTSIFFQKKSDFADFVVYN